MQPPTSSALAPLRNRLYLSYFFTGLMANFGWLIQLVGASWLMTSIGGSPEMVGLVQTSLAVPIMLFSLLAGAMADSFGRRTMVLWSQSFLLIVSTTLAVFAYLDMVTPWTLLAFTFLIGSGKALNNPAWQTMVRELVVPAEMPAAISLNSVGFNIARSVGPALGGAIVAAVGAFAAFVINALSNVGMIVVMARWRFESPPRNLPPEPVGAAMLAGIRYVAMSPHLLAVMLRAAAFNFAAISVMALMPLIARDLVQGGAEIYGLLLGSFGVGAILGAMLGGRLRAALSLEGLARVGFLSFAAATVVIGLSGNVYLTLAACAAAGASWLLTLSTFNTTVQLSSPRWVGSRSQALYQTASFGGNALGSWVWGSLAASHGNAESLFISAAALVAGAALGLIFALRELDSSGLDQHSRWNVPKMALDILPRSGPILTTQEYVIREEDVTEFLSVMAERRRGRMRDGARQWLLARDIENPQLWIERYKTATWVETQRHHERRTLADAAITDRLRALHQGDGLPKMRHLLVRQTGWSAAQNVLGADGFSP
ncbi:MFS transporter [Phaeovulum sp. W22_SRMD_FR3]|uniref:MFS transporter n=1 Tax=Phaeovulum sp. W22_SRMD_FR3 TaxID=3240274 RepID=UPI003F962339